MESVSSEALLKKLYIELIDTRKELHAAKKQLGLDMAVVGGACRFPGGVDTLDSYWELLSSGRDPIGPIPESRWNHAEFFDSSPDANGKVYSREGGFIDDIAHFDATFFDISPREAAEMDPQQRLLLELSWETFRHAGHNLLEMKGSNTGVFLGMSTDDYAAMTMHSGDHTTIDAYNSLGTARSVAAGRIAYTWGFHGPVIQVDTACSSSLTALHLACQSIIGGDCEQALVAGINLILSPEMHIACSRLRALSPTSRCKVFDDGADGYVRSEGAGCVLIKPLHRAMQDGDRVLGVIKSCAINHDGKSNGLTAPNGRAQVQLIRKALKRSGLQASHVGYVELHGTGTRLGDPIEVHALGDALQRKGRHGSSKSPLLLGSVKSNIGHLEAAAGMASLLKAILVQQKGMIPGNLHYDTPNRQIRWDQLDVKVVDKATPWPPHPETDLIGISAFGLSGTNVHVILGPAPQHALIKKVVPPRESHLLTLSGRDQEALRAQLQQSALLLDHLPGEQFSDWCSAHSVHSMHYPQRKALVAATPQEMKHALNHALNIPASDTVGSAEHICFVFTGQGSQYAGMGRELAEQVPAFRHHMEALAPSFEAHIGVPLSQLWWGEHSAQLNQTRLTQPALFAFEYCLAKTLIDWQIKPDICLGHSVGEYVAACISGMLSPEDALRCIALRARCMAACDAAGVMVAVLAPNERVQQALREWDIALPNKVSIAAYNSPNSTVISGDAEVVLAIMNQLVNEGVRCVQLDVSHAFHSPLMQPAAEAFVTQIAPFSVKDGDVPLISNVTAQLLECKDLTPEYLAHHIVAPVRFTDCIRSAVELGSNVFIEIGPKSTLTQLLSQIVRDVPIYAVAAISQAKQPVHSLLQCLGKVYELGVNPDWRKVFDGVSFHHVERLDYPFSRQRLWTRSKKKSGLHSQSEKSVPSLYHTEWSEITTTDHNEDAGDWLLLQWETDFSNWVERGLSESGARVHQLSLGEQPHEHHLTEVMEALQSKPWRGLIVAMDVGTAKEEDIGDTRLYASSIEKMAFIGQLFIQVESLADAKQTQTQWLSRGMWLTLDQAVGTSTLVKGAFQGFAKAASLEKRRRWGGVIDIADRSDTTLVQLANVLCGVERDVISIEQGVTKKPRLQPIIQKDSSPFKFSADDAVLIAGGAGGIGLNLCEWCVARGLRRVLIVGRRDWATLGEAALVFERIKAAGVSITYRALDLSDAQELEQAVMEFEAEQVPLTGFIHAAGVASLLSLEKIDAQTLASTMDGKLKGAWHMHKLAQARNTRLFVMCSSISSLWGGLNLAHYSAANACLDALAKVRMDQGVPVHCIQWGPWKESGMARDTVTHDMNRMGVQAFDNASARQYFYQIIDSNSGVYVAVNADWMTLSRTFAASPRAQLFDKLVSAEVTENDKPKVPVLKKSPAHALHTFDASALHAYVTDLVMDTLAHQLQLDRARIRLDAPLTELGLDSILAVEVGRAFESALGLPLPATLLFDAPNTHMLIENLYDRLPKASPKNAVAVQPIPIPASREKTLTNMILMIRQLDDNALDQLLSA